MSSENYSDTLPILADRGFDTAMRGYDRRQVDEYVANLDDEVRAAMADRDAALARSADLAAQLASAQAQIESLKRQLRKATEQVTTDNLDSRMREMLDSAAAESSKMRADADAYVLAVRRGADDSAERIRTSARREAEQILADATQRHAEADEMFRQRIAEVERERADATVQIEQDLTRARAEEDQLTVEALEARARLDEEALAERGRQQAELEQRLATAKEDFEITLRLRRTEEARRSAELLKAAEADAEQVRVEAHAAAEDLLHDAREELQQLRMRRDDTHAALHGLHAKIAGLLAEIDTSSDGAPDQDQAAAATAKPRGRGRR